MSTRPRDFLPAAFNMSLLSAWAKERVALAEQLRFSAESELSLASFVIDPSEKPASAFGWYEHHGWLQQLAGILVADWASYPRLPDQVTLARLQFVLHNFPQGFRSWWVETTAAGWLPIGYSGWYPISRRNFDAIESDPSAITDRGLAVPLTSLAPDNNFIYVFNYSLAPGFQRTSISRKLLVTLAEELKGVRVAGLSAITVSDDGARVAKRFGMKLRGTCTVDGTLESVYSMRSSQ